MAWSYHFAQETANDHQDYISDISMVPDGKFFATAMWGNSLKTSPTIAVFSYFNSTPIFQYVTPGSMRSISISYANENLWVAAGGKHQHANDYGSGGDLFAIKLHFSGALAEFDKKSSD